MQLTPARMSAELIRYDSHTGHPVASLVRTELPPGSLGRDGAGSGAAMSLESYQ